MLNKYYRGTIAFTREGKSYLNSYPTFSNWAGIIYTFVFPMLINYCIWLRVTNEISQASELYPYIITNFICYILIGVSSCLYLIKMHYIFIVDTWLKIKAIALIRVWWP